ncbi:calcium-binding protein [Inquilinus sp. Marseille-Q2685]|uniref:calcium-binding protein n=1 Tax=Inquilinus sp. Marseille-Q2685 TaxID=2866581 RepID=UPI001CE3E27D|nr:calcium-binding protein [Inquilinus sp. Marseille-Q2685]
MTTIYGDAAGNLLVGGAWDDILFGFDGNDFLQGGAGADALFGGAGIDTADYNGNAGVSVDLAAGQGWGGEAEGDRLFDIENVWGTGGYGDILAGSDAGNELRGFGGNDTLYGRDGDDRLVGGMADDFLQGGAGADSIDGGDGTDTVDYNGLEGVHVDLGRGIAEFGEAQGDVITGVENVWGTAYGDVLVGTSSGSDLRGWGGDDFLGGGPAGDLLYGNDGSDRLIGDGGADTLSGGAGADAFEFWSVTDSQAGTGADWIIDFHQAEGDVIDLVVMDADATAAGRQGFGFIWNAPFSHQAGELRYEIDGGATTVLGDVDGDGAADLRITLSGAVSLQLGDFAL